MFEKGNSKVLLILRNGYRSFFGFLLKFVKINWFNTKHDPQISYYYFSIVYYFNYIAFYASPSINF